MFTALPAIAVLAVLGAVLAFTHRDSSADDRRMETRQLAIAASLNARRFVEDQFAILAAVAASPAVRTENLAQLRRYIPDVSRDGRFSSGLGFIDARGFSRVSSVKLPPGTPPVNVSDRDYFRQALQGRPAISDVLISKVRKRPIVVFAYPTVGDDGERNGALAGSLALDAFDDDLRRLLYAPNAGETILDSANHVIVGARPVKGLEAAPAGYPVTRLRARRSGVLDKVDDRVLGYARVEGTDWVVVVSRDRGKLIGPLDNALLAELGALALLALVGVLLTFVTARRLDRLDREREGALTEQRAIALQLQRSLLPDLSVPEGLEAYAGYVPAQGAVAVGGDWYDLVDLGAGRVALSVGDVAGHGLKAAATMGKLRSATRSEALHSSLPTDALSNLDRFASTLDEHPLATVVYAVLELATGRLRYASAGHPPPLLVRADGTTSYLEGGRSPLLGVEPVVPRVEAEARLDPGDTLIVYTDGLVERPDRSIDAGLEALAGRAVKLTRDPSRIAERLLAGVEEPRRDDAAVLVVRLASVRQPSSVAV